MYNRLLAFAKGYDMLQPGDKVVCALSGGADSVAMTFALYLLKDTLGITLEAAHFNHRLRGEESDRDEAFVKDFCSRYDIPLHLGAGAVERGEKGLEAAAREARYAFLDTLPGKIATAHTADDNAETVLMHLVRGTGLKGLGGITPVRGRIIRPMLDITRQEVLAFLQEYHLSFITDSSNDTEDFLRNRLRHRVMPLLQQENPEFSRNTSAMAQRLRADEQALEALSQPELTVSQLRALPAALRSRSLKRLLEGFGVKEPEARHIALAESLVFSDNPSAQGHFPGNVTVARCYDRLQLLKEAESYCIELSGPGVYALPGFRLTVSPASVRENSPYRFTVPGGSPIVARSRRAGDSFATPGGTKSLKKLFIDRKIPAHQRNAVPVVANETQVLGVCGLGADMKGQTLEPVWVLEFFPIEREGRS